MATKSFSEFQKERLLHKLGDKLNAEGELLIRSDQFRDQDQNRKACIEKLGIILKEALFVPKKRVATKPKKSAVRRRLEGKKIRGDIKKGRSGQW